MINKKNLFLCVIVFMMAFCIRLYFITQKQGFFIDEIYTRTTVVGKFLDIKKMSMLPYKYFRAKSIKNWIFEKPETSTLYDLKQIWKNNYNDSAHPNLYFYLIRLGLNISDFSTQGFLNFGCGLNLIFFTFSFFIMSKILIRLFGDNKLVPIGLALAFLNTGTISMTVFVRPYEMQIFGIIFISYIYLIFDDKLKNNENLLNLKDILILIFSLAFVSLIGYFLVIYFFILGLLLLWKSRFNKKNILALCLGVFLSLIVILLVCPAYFQFINDDQFVRVSQNYKFIPAFLPRINILFSLFIDFIFYKIVLFITFFSLFFIDYKKKTNEQCLTLFVSSIVWLVIISYIVSHVLIRYLAPCFPIVSLGLLLLLSKIKTSKQNIFSIIFICTYVLTAIFPFKQEFNNPIVYDKHFSLKGGAKFENLWAMQKPYFNPNIPVYILMDKYSFLEPLNLYSTFDDNQKLIVKNIFNYSDFTVNHDEFYIITLLDIDALKKKYSIKNMDRYFYFDTYYARLKDGKE